MDTHPMLKGTLDLYSGTSGEIRLSIKSPASKILDPLRPFTLNNSFAYKIPADGINGSNWIYGD
jgi:hypothetical protein